jgi:hypothetical protein
MKIIAFNTNAGGALINVFVARAQKACCPAIESVYPGPVRIAVRTYWIAFARSGAVSRATPHSRPSLLSILTRTSSHR